MFKLPLCTAVLLGLMGAASAQADPQVRTTFSVRYVVDGSVYLDAGSNAGLREGMKLTVSDTPAQAEASGENPDKYLVATLVIDSVASTSAVCTVTLTTRQLRRGDVAALSSADTERLVEANVLSNTRRYPAVVSFTEGDPMDEDVRDAIPRPPLPEVNRAVGRIGFDYYGTSSNGGLAANSSDVGVVFRADITRIAGTHWNLSGYWRGRISSRSSNSQPTIQDLLNRTYHISLTYDNPDSKWVAGFGRMYLPWASSLETIDGGYVGRRLSHTTTAGIFAGSTPDPSSWNYDPQQRIGGSFINVTGGSYEAVRYSSTVGFGVDMLGFNITRPFAFAENSISYGQQLSIYHSFQVDKPKTDSALQAVNFGISRSFLTVHYQASRRVGFDFNHNYFRDVPTYDPLLVGTGLLDKYLFQGFSVGTRVEAPAHLSFYVNLGRSSNSTDAKPSWNQMYEATLNRVWRTKLRLDARYSKFDSAFAKGDYRSLSVSRNFGQDFRWELIAGNQTFLSPYTTDTGTRFVGSNVDFSIGTHYFFQAGLNLQRGAMQNYNQWFTTFGYRFDNRQRGR
ncbi:MAG: hypothetical protein ACXVZV_09730 [Terriglobales bacterium]